MRLIDADADALHINIIGGRMDGKMAFADAVKAMISDAPTVDAIPVAFIESEKQRVNVMIVEEAKAGNIKEADRLSTIMAVMDAIISNWRYIAGNDWRAENDRTEKQISKGQL